jgi:hypothetical protein
MRTFSAILFFILLTTNLPAGMANRIPAQNEPNPEPASGSVVCVPGVYVVAPDDCLPLGPSQGITRAASEGIPYPIQPLPVYTPDTALTDLPYQYFKVTETGTPLFFTLDDGLANQPANSIEPGFLYVSYQYRAETEQGVFYQLRDNSWIRGDGARAAWTDFQGLLFSSTPRQSFGWVLGQVPSYQSPGFNAFETGKVYNRYQVVQIYAVRETDENTWLMVGPDEWLDYRQVSRVDVQNAPPEGVTTGRWIDVNLDEQTLAVYQDNQLVFATIVSTGVEPFWTRPGLFQIYEKKDIETMSGSTAADRSDYYYLQDVPWTMYFDEKRALHGEYWHTSLGYSRSHGCVNLSVGDSHWLYNWASVGDYVYVYDPSGRTPTDPSLYGAGSP